MENFQLFEFLPLWITFGGVVALVLVSIVLGVYFAKARKKKVGVEDEGPIGTVVSATLGLLAFILAFTFGLTASRFDARRQLLLDDATLIETTAMRAELIPEPQRSDVRQIMKKYIELRLDMPSDAKEILERVKQSEDLQRQLWAQAASLSNADLKNPDIVSLFIDSVNELINVQTRRVSVANYHIHWLIWLVLFGVTILSMMQVGYLFGRSGSSNWLFIVALSLAFSGVMILIIDLDRSGTSAVGSIRVSQQPIKDLHQRLYGPAR